MRPSRIRATLVVLVMSLSACAFTDIRLTLPTRKLESTVPGGNGRQVIVLTPFVDEREVRERCGRQINGYGMDTADAICQSDPTAWIAERLTDELRASGFTVLEESAEHRPGALRVDGSLLRLFVEPKIGFWSGSLEADLSVKLRATSQTGLVSERTFFVKGWKGGVMASTTQPYLTSLHRATQALVEEMVRAVVELMDRYPQLGSREFPGVVLALRTEEVPR
jgi:hypothetical protein